MARYERAGLLAEKAFDVAGQATTSLPIIIRANRVVRRDEAIE